MMVNQIISTFGFGHTGFGFILQIVKVRDFNVGCTNGVVRFDYHLICMANAMRKEGVV